MHLVDLQAVVLPAIHPVPDLFPAVFFTARRKLLGVERTAGGIIPERAVGVDRRLAVVLLSRCLKTLCGTEIARILDRHLHAFEDEFFLLFSGNERPDQVGVLESDGVAVDELWLRALVHLEPCQVILQRKRTPTSGCTAIIAASA